MDSLLNPARPPAFCPGCSHERSLKALDQAFLNLGLAKEKITMVSDIGCSGLFDTFFNTHAMHGLHGRALTYATGIKLACPDLKVIATMGDGGLGIGGAHFLAACRRNIDLTLLILNNFNFGMTGGQFSCTTPAHAITASDFLSALERPMDVCSVAAAAGAPFVARASVYLKGLSALLEQAIAYEGFSVVDIWGICTGRYLKTNELSPRDIETALQSLPSFNGPVKTNERPEYGNHYRQRQPHGDKGTLWHEVKPVFPAPINSRREVVLLGSAGERIISAGFLLSEAAVMAGLQVTQKNDHNITIMRGPSVVELVISPESINFTGIEQPDIIACLSQEGTLKRQDLFKKITKKCRIIKAADVIIPPTSGNILDVDFKAHGIKKRERALAVISMLAINNDPISHETLRAALQKTLKGKSFQDSMDVLRRSKALLYRL